MSVEFVLRLAGMVLFAIASWQTSVTLFQSSNPGESLRLVIVLTMAGAAIGLLIAPYLTIHPFDWVQRKLRQLPASHLISGVIGLVIGLAISALLYPSLSNLPNPYGQVMPMVVSLFSAYICASVMIMRQHDLFSLIGPRITLFSNSVPDLGQKKPEDIVLLDTSVIIDGRITDISQTGFIRSTMMVPRFVLNELQHIADSPDPLRRNRGRRGLELLNQLQEDSQAPVQIKDIDVEGVKAVDDKLVMLAKQLDCPIITNDFNLNSVAKLQGVVVLNINELANAVKTVILPGEPMKIQIIQEGKEREQGVAYLSDGTMVVVENGRHYIGKSVPITVTKVLQTSAGRMIFGKMEK
jgi:uncharacterized protein YacL